jgi:hypothetical protein
VVAVFINFHHMLAARRRRRALEKIRREFARCGYPLDGVADAELEASLPPGTCETPPVHLGAKTISRALRRLPVRGARRHRYEPEEVKRDVGHGRRAASTLRKVRR